MKFFSKNDTIKGNTESLYERINEDFSGANPEARWNHAAEL